MNQVLYSLSILLYVVSGLMLLGLTARGVGAFVLGLQSPDNRAEYVRLPFLLPAMAAGVALNVFYPSIVLYLMVGVLWGLTFPLRFAVRNALAEQRRPDWSVLRDRKHWLLAAGLTVLHAALWPLTVPISYFLGNELSAN